MGIYDFLKTSKKYKQSGAMRMNLRHRFLIEPYHDDIIDSRVLDLASHDGRWAWAFAKSGAKSVIGIEGRQTLVDLFDGFPDESSKSKVQLIVGDIFTNLEKFVRRNETFDVVAIFGIFYHIMDHYRLLNLVRNVSPKLVIIDSEFIVHKNNPMVSIIMEDTRKKLNTIPFFPGQIKAPKGVVSLKGLEVMADSLGYETNWLDWKIVPKKLREPVSDYYRPGKKRRFTCYLRPILTPPL